MKKQLDVEKSQSQSKMCNLHAGVSLGDASLTHEVTLEGGFGVWIFVVETTAALEVVRDDLIEGWRDKRHPLRCQRLLKHAHYCLGHLQGDRGK